MDLKELEKVWSEMDREIKNQKKLTNQLIMDMTQEKYRNKFRKLSTFETIGGIICILSGVYILSKFNLLDTWYLQLCGGFTVFFLLLLPVITLWSLRKVQTLRITDAPIKETTIRYLRAKNQLLLIQRFGIYLSFFLMIAMLPVAGKIMNGKDLFLSASLWYTYLPIMTVFLFFFARWGYGCYKSLTQSAEKLLTDLE